MNPHSWYICPILFIPAALLWGGLWVFCEHIQLCQRLVSRFGWKMRTTVKWLNGILYVISLLLTTVILFLVSYLIGFDLLNWEPFA
jgi:hypothetical protein